MSKVSSKLVAGVSKVKAKPAAAPATKQPAAPEKQVRRPVENPAARGAVVPPMPVWPD